MTDSEKIEIIPCLISIDFSTRGLRYYLVVYFSYLRFQAIIIDKITFFES
jgi:hypothetical protein